MRASGLEIVSIQQEYKEIGFAETSNKKVLGLLNEFAFEYEFIIKRKEGLETSTSLRLIGRLTGLSR